MEPSEVKISDIMKYFDFEKATEFMQEWKGLGQKGQDEIKEMYALMRSTQ